MRIPLLMTLRTGPAGTFAVRLPRVVSFGYGTRAEVSALASEYGERVCFVVGRRSLKAAGVLNELLDSAKEANLDPFVFDGVEPEPLVSTVDALREVLDEQQVEVVIPVGGGSVLDVGKAAAALIDSQWPTADHLAGAQMPDDGLPIIALPTTAGTGAEVTPNAVLRDLQAGVKASIRGEHLLPVAAIVDPQLTMGAPPEVTAYSGLDALVQAIEAYTSLGANPFTDALAAEAVVRIGTALPIVYLDGKSWPGRESLALGSLFAGIALACARLGLVHGLAHPLGMMYHLPHGMVCALLLPHVIEFNIPACGQKYALLARALGVGETAEDFLNWTRELLPRLGVHTTLYDQGLVPDDFPKIVPPTLESGSTKHNPREVTEDDLIALLRHILDPTSPLPAPREDDQHGTDQRA
ncbi:MAG: iron-containing alcohol dehydrogenase family protein [Candidatus Zipacnadales bacterium]